MRRIICAVLCFVMICPMNSIAYAGEIEPEDAVITCVRNIDSSFLLTISEIKEDTEVLFSPLGYTELTDFIKDDDYIGYVITIDGVVVEFAQQESPYHKFSDKYEDYIFYYDYANYGFMNNDMPICFDIDGKIKNQNLSDTDMGISTQAVLPGVTPQLQGSSNCIVAALANIMWYWGNHGFPSLTSGKSFSGVKNSINSLFVNYGQGYSNNAVPTIAALYGSGVSPNVSFNASTVWTNSPATMVGEIDHGYPCMVGFAAGSSYSQTVGHMTMCFGYYYSGTIIYIVLADGHSDSSVTKIWSSYNDCTIKLRPY